MTTTPQRTRPAPRVVPAASDVPAHWDLPDFFTRYAAALEEGDLAAIAACHGEPTFVITDEGAFPVEDRRGVRALFHRAVTAYRLDELVSVRATLRASTTLSPHLCEALVRWTYGSPSREADIVDDHFYILRRTPGAQPQIQALVAVGGASSEEAPPPARPPRPGGHPAPRR